MGPVLRGRPGAIRDAALSRARVSQTAFEEAPVMETVSQSAWHTPWIFLLALVCFVVEWGLP